MRVTMLRQMEYEGTYIYVNVFGDVLQYLFVWDKEIFMRNERVRPRPELWLLWKLRLAIHPYTRDDLEDLEHVMLSGAMASIDQLKTPEEKKKRAKISKENKKSPDCAWQTFNDKDGAIYLCMTHDKMVPMEAGKYPKHK